MTLLAGLTELVRENERMTTDDTERQHDLALKARRSHELTVSARLAQHALHTDNRLINLIDDCTDVEAEIGVFLALLAIHRQKLTDHIAQLDLTPEQRAELCDLINRLHQSSLAVGFTMINPHQQKGTPPQ